MNGTDLANKCGAAGAGTGSHLLSQALQLLNRLDVFFPHSDTPVVNFKHPAVLKKELDLAIGVATEDAELLTLLEDIIRNSVKTHHPFFHNQLYGAVDPYGLVGAVVTECLNTNQVTYDIAPAFTLVENTILEHVLSVVGYTSGEGQFSPGGSLSNMYGMMLARHKLAPQARQKGIASLPTLVVFTSQNSHYSIGKGANWLGIGTDNVVSVKSDDRGRMIPALLEEAIAEAKTAGKLPLMVNATAGSTVLGAFDPLQEIADVCRRHGVWLHVDACWGGSLMFSKKFKHRLAGINLADSIAWNPHKMLGAPLQCSLFLTQHKGALLACNSASASYLFPQDKFYDVSYDTGDKSVQCGRKVDALKLWVMWRARGDHGFEQLVDNAMDCAEYFRCKISKRPGFKLVLPEFECTNICFWYIPSKLRNKEENKEWWAKIDKVAPKIKEQMTLAGSLLIGYQPLHHLGHVNFFRMVVTCHPQQTTRDMDRVIELIEQAGEKVLL